ncbi:MAG TPA: hypothetical protein PKA93_14785 [Arachnia sp.]|mgnify:CR=1 FL=1|nr:hypothetical protein [Arachnia sp.]
MKALRTQFDADEFAGVVATPTCSSCCCCSCCVSTLAGAGAVGAVTVAAVASDSGRPRAQMRWLGVFAALLPTLALLCWVGVLALIGELIQGGIAIPTLLVLLSVLLAFLIGGYAVLFRALRGGPATGLAVRRGLGVLVLLVIETVAGAYIVVQGYGVAYLVGAGVVLGVVGVVLARPAVRERLARSVRGIAPMPYDG